MSESPWFHLPGLCDCHVHFREPGLEHKGTMASEGAAARKGGIVVACDMPNTVPPTNSFAALADKVDRAARVAHLVDMRFYFGVTTASHLADLEALWTVSDYASLKARCCGLKLYLEHSTGDMKADDSVVEDAFHLCGKLSIPLVCHCEHCGVNSDALRQRGWTTVADAPDDVRLHSELRPVRSETQSIAESIERAARHGASLHIAHLSTAEGLRLVTDARGRGLRVTCEVSPHHLFMSTDDYQTHGTKVKVNVPLRALTDRDEMWEGLLDGRISCVATDHAPHLLTEKEGGPSCGCPVKPLAAPSGIPGVDAVVPLLVSVALRQWPHPTSDPPPAVRRMWASTSFDSPWRASVGIVAPSAADPAAGFMLNVIADAMHYQPNALLRLNLKHSDASLTTAVRLDTACHAFGPTTIKCGWSPYDGWMVRGRVCRSDDVPA